MKHQNIYKLVPAIISISLVACGGGNHSGSSSSSIFSSYSSNSSSSASSVIGLADNAKVPVLLYHSWNVNPPCDYNNSDIQALKEDLETLHDHGFTIIPLQHQQEGHIQLYHHT